MQVLLQIPLILHIELILRILLCQLNLLTVLPHNRLLPQILHNTIPIVQGHPLPNLIENRTRNRSLHTLIRFHILVKLVTDCIGLQQELAAADCLDLLSN